MDQRRLKVGDIVDDYCPRERRLTDHAIVAMIDDTIRQTRCTACDNEHPYKEARLPRPRKKAAPGALYNEVLADVTDTPAAAATPEPPAADAVAASAKTASEEQPTSTDEGTPAPAPAPDEHEGPVHRPLIRATLPRPEGTAAAARQMPEFTIRQPGGRGGRFREDFRAGGGGGFRAGGRNGNQQAHGRPSRPGGSNQQSRPRHGRPAPHKKRSR
jgi:hypothetical protein